MTDPHSTSHSSHGLIQWHGTTIIGVKRGDQTVIAGDGQVSMGNTVMNDINGFRVYSQVVCCRLGHLVGASQDPLCGRVEVPVNGFMVKFFPGIDAMFFDDMARYFCLA